MIPISVYNPTGSGAVHTDKVISGGKSKVAAKKANPFDKKTPTKKMPPFAKKMADPMSPPGSMSGTKGGKVSGLGVAKKATKKAVPKAMGEVPKAKVATPRQQRAATPGKRTQRVTGGRAMC